MEFSEAAELIEKYHKAIKDLRPQALIQSDKYLPCTSGRLKYAHYIFGEAMVKGELLTEDLLLLLTESYGLIDSLFSEGEEGENLLYKNYIDALKRGEVTDYNLPNPFGESKDVLEYFNFLGETAFKLKISIPKPDIFASFVYQELTNKAKKEGDSKALIVLANSSLTRAVPFPDKKKNEDCNFI